MKSSSVHLSDEEIDRYCTRKMQVAELLPADRHLATCDQCHTRMIQVLTRRGKLTAATHAFDQAARCEITHLEYEQLAALVDGQLGEIDREIALSHLEICPECESELEDLREVSSRIAVPLDARTGRSIRERLTGWWRSPMFRIPAEATAAVGLAGLLAFLISIPIRKQNAQLSARVAELERSNDALTEQVAAGEAAKREVAALREENELLKQSGSTAGNILVALTDGGSRITLDKQGNLAGVQTDARYEPLVSQALRAERVPIPAAIRELRTNSGTLMGSSQAEFNVVSPVGVCTETDRPTLRWTLLQGAASYNVSVYNSSMTKVAESGSLTGTEWTPTERLARGSVYIWQVRAIKDGQQTIAPPPAAGRAKFKVVEQSALDEIERARHAKVRSHLVMGIVYARAGLLDQAEQELSALVRENPGSPIARKLAQSVRAPRR
jgi:hypothetical protein